MPPLVLSDDEKAAALKKGSSDLRFLFSRNEVNEDVVAKWLHAGVVTLEKFANIAKSPEDLADVLKDHIGVDASRTLEERVTTAAVTCAWSNARTRVSRAAELEAEVDAREWKKPLVQSEWLAMKAGLEASAGRMDDKVTPAKEYVEKKLQEVESGEYRAEELSEVISKEESDPDSLIPQWDSKGTLTVKRGSTKVKEPENPEALRVRLSVMRNALQMIALKRTNRPELQGDYVRTFEDMKDYLLGEHVYGLHAKDAEGQTVAAPPFRLVLAYERAVRREAMRRVNQDGVPLPKALREAWRDPTTKERYFTTPLALQVKRPAPQKVEPKGGKDKGKGKPKLPGCASQTADGTPVCYRFNTPGERCKQRKCKFAHVCGICFSDKHAMFQCTASKRQPPDTAGQGASA